MSHLSIRVDFDGAGAFGPGKAQLLELVEKEGSIRSAAAAMEMSYRRAWMLLQSIEKTFGTPAVATATGGKKGGGASLTRTGKALVALYRAVEHSAARATAQNVSAMRKLKAPAKKPEKAPKRAIKPSARTATRRR